jgi:hypothetical protein
MRRRAAASHCCQRRCGQVLSLLALLVPKYLLYVKEEDSFLYLLYFTSLLALLVPEYLLCVKEEDSFLFTTALLALLVPKYLLYVKEEDSFLALLSGSVRARGCRLRTIKAQLRHY